MLACYLQPAKEETDKPDTSETILMKKQMLCNIPKYPDKHVKKGIQDKQKSTKS